jgi:hypothetical protein
MFRSVLVTAILDRNEYTVFCDLKRNRGRTRLSTLKRVLNNARYKSTLDRPPPSPSPERTRVADFSAGRSAAIPPLPWPVLTPTVSPC